MSQHTPDIDFSTASGEMDSETGNYAISVRHPDKPQYAMRLADIYPGCNFYNTQLVGESVVRILQSHADLLAALKAMMIWVENSSAASYGDTNDLRKYDRNLLADAIEVSRAALRRADEGG